MIKTKGKVLLITIVLVIVINLSCSLVRAEIYPESRFIIIDKIECIEPEYYMVLSDLLLSFKSHTSLSINVFICDDREQIQNFIKTDDKDTIYMILKLNDHVEIQTGACLGKKMDEIRERCHSLFSGNVEEVLNELLTLMSIISPDYQISIDMVIELLKLSLD